MERSVIKCKIPKNHDYGSDHLPIITILNFKPETNTQTLTFNYDKTDWDMLKAKPEEYLPKITTSTRPTPTSVDRLAHNSGHRKPNSMLNSTEGNMPIQQKIVE